MHAVYTDAGRFSEKGCRETRELLCRFLGIGKMRRSRPLSIFTGTEIIAGVIGPARRAIGFAVRAPLRETCAQSADFGAGIGMFFRASDRGAASSYHSYTTTNLQQFYAEGRA